MSCEESESVPSTEKQSLLARELVCELHKMGVENAYMSDMGYVYAGIEANAEGFPPLVSSPTWTHRPTHPIFL